MATKPYKIVTSIEGLKFLEKVFKGEVERQLKEDDENKP